MPEDEDPELLTEREIEHEAAIEPDDPQTSREELELELMEEGDSIEGEEIGEETP
jgi:hypothetical protein